MNFAEGSCACFAAEQGVHQFEIVYIKRYDRPCFLRSLFQSALRKIHEADKGVPLRYGIHEGNTAQHVGIAFHGMYDERGQHAETDQKQQTQHHGMICDGLQAFFHEFCRKDRQHIPVVDACGHGVDIACVALAPLRRMQQDSTALLFGKHALQRGDGGLVAAVLTQLFKEVVRRHDAVNAALGHDDDLSFAVDYKSSGLIFPELQ